MLHQIYRVCVNSDAWCQPYQKIDFTFCVYVDLALHAWHTSITSLPCMYHIAHPLLLKVLHVSYLQVATVSNQGEKYQLHFSLQALLPEQRALHADSYRRIGRLWKQKVASNEHLTLTYLTHYWHKLRNLVESWKPSWLGCTFSVTFAVLKFNCFFFLVTWGGHFVIWFMRN